MEQPELYSSRLDLTRLNEAVDQLKNEIGKVIVGQKGMVDLIIAGLLCHGHVIIEGVPGIAKTLTARLVARALSVKFSRIQFTPDLMPADITGTSVFNFKTSEFNFRQGPIFSNLVLIDEINRSPAKTQAALFEVMEERQVTTDGVTYKLDEPFMVIATQNPIEHEGTYRLPEAQLDRFLFRIKIGYPDPEDEMKILKGVHERKHASDTSMIKPVLTGEDILHFQQNVREVHIDENLMHYIATIIVKTRNDRSIYLGASPRASVSVMMASKAFAAINGRDFVTPEDIKHVVIPVLNHRILLTPEKEMEGVQPEQVIQQIVAGVEIPR